MSFKKNINDIKKNYSLGIIGGGQLALMLTEAAKKRDLEVCVQTKSCVDGVRRSPYESRLVVRPPPTPPSSPCF